MKNLRNFGIIFAISLVILGIAAIFACGYVSDTVCSIFTESTDSLDKLLAPDPAETTGIGNEGEDDRMTRSLNGESFTWLMVVSDYRPSVFKNYYPQSAKEVDKLKDFGILDDEYKLVEATNIVLIRADVKTREYVVMSIPHATKVETPAGSYTLGQLYGLSGADALCDKVAGITGLPIDYYSVIHSTDLSSVANAIGSIECNIPVDIGFDGKNYVDMPIEETKDKKETEKKKDDKNDTNKKDTTKA